MINLVFFLTGFIVGMLALLLIIVTYENNYVVKIEKEQRQVLDEVQKEIQMGNGRKSIKMK